VSYPHRSGDIPDERFCAALESVALPRYTGRLDEATSALDEPLEFMIYGLVHRELLGDGRWRFGPLDKVAVRAGAPV